LNRREKRVEKLGEILSRLIRSEGYERKSPQGPVFAAWPEVVGELLSQKSWPVSLRKGVLLVQVSDSVWMQELQMQKHQILERIGAVRGGGEITDLRWTVRGAPTRVSLRKRRAHPPVLSSRPLTEEESAWVGAVSAQVEDPDLRKTLQRVLGKYLRAPKRG
jgi:hypothetical protein